jgi:hypothetical protein
MALMKGKKFHDWLIEVGFPGRIILLGVINGMWN